MKNKDYKQSIESPEIFWEHQAKKIEWQLFPTTILSKDEKNYYQWFADGKINICDIAIDKHIREGYGDQVAFIYDSPVTNTIQHITYAQAQYQIAHLAGGLRNLGLTKGDTAIIYIPMIPQAAFAMLACARLGVTHSVVFGGFAPHELAIRIDDCKPKIIITASLGIEINKEIPYLPLVQEAMSQSEFTPEKCVVFDRKIGHKMTFSDSIIDFQKLIDTSPPANCEILDSLHPLYILYTSGTTGKPKGIVRDHGGYATALQFSMTEIYGVQPGEVYWAASDIGWAVGHSFSIYGPLINRNTTVIFEGKPIMTPNAGTFWRVISEHKVAVMFTAPTAIRAIKKEDPNGEWVKKYDLSHYRKQFLAGERCDIATLEWFDEHLGIPAIDHWWQTESGWPMISLMNSDEVHEIRRGSAGKPVAGYDIRVFNEDGQEQEAGKEAFVVIKLPLPPGTMLDLWQDSERFMSSYMSQFEGYYLTGDGGYKDTEGYVFITGRVDDVINVAGHRLSTSEMEEVVASNTKVAECAVVGVEDELKGQVPVAIVVLKAGVEDVIADIEKEIIAKVREQIGAVASLRKVVVVHRLPKTRSGKILRKLIRSLLDKKDFVVPSTIDDVDIISELQLAFDTY